MRVELPSKSPTVGLNWARAIFIIGDQGVPDTSCCSSSGALAGKQFVKPMGVTDGALKCAATNANRNGRLPGPQKRDRPLQIQRQSQIQGNANLTGEKPALRAAARGQKKLPKDFSFGRYSCPHMKKLRSGGALFSVRLA